MKPAIAAMLILALPALVAGQSLGEMARKEKERQKKAQAGANDHVITDADLATTRGQLANDPKESSKPAASPSPAQATTRPPASGAPDTRQEEEAWRSRVAQATARLDAARKHWDQARNLPVIPGVAYVDQNGNRVSRPQDAIAQARAEFETAQKALDDLLESARRQNIPPGWLR